MNNIFDSAKLEKFRNFCSGTERIAIVSHNNPDGDAVGSGLALLYFLRAGGFNVRFFVPNRHPQFLVWIDPGNDIEIFNEMHGEATAYIAAADLIICVDFNVMHRLEKMAGAVEANFHARKVLIDHHLEPGEFDLVFSDTRFSSTSQMVYEMLRLLGGGDAIDLPIANALYAGIMTDTGGFSYGHLSGDLFRAVADLIDKGVDPVMAHRLVYDTMSESRMRMLGYLLCEKMKVFPEHHAAYISITNDEKTRFDHQIGDTEGIANLPLSITGVRFSALLIETADCIKVSLRSQGDFDVNELSRKYFNGGGHKNAAGGKLFTSMDEAIAATEKVILSVYP